MSGSYSAINDRDFDLVRKQAWNWYEIAYAAGISNLQPPNINDTYVVLLKKIAFYTAALAEV